MAHPIPVGTKFITQYGRDPLGRWYWREDGKPTIHGPFNTMKEAVGT